MPVDADSFIFIWRRGDGQVLLPMLPLLLPLPLLLLPPPSSPRFGDERSCIVTLCPFSCWRAWLAMPVRCCLLLQFVQYSGSVFTLFESRGRCASPPVFCDRACELRQLAAAAFPFPRPALGQRERRLHAAHVRETPQSALLF